MAVSTAHPDYTLHLDEWLTTRDACAGQGAIKGAAERYLPHFSPHDEERYKQYLKRAYFLGVTGRTKRSLIGMVFRKPPTYTLPASIESLLEDIDGTGQSLEQLSKAAAGALLETGRYALLVDYPEAEDGLDSESEARMGMRPTIAAYGAWNLINWRVEGVRGQQMLTLAVLREVVEKDDFNEFSHDWEYRYRVLRLSDGVYTQQIYDHAQQPISEQRVVRAAGQTLDRIPLHIIGAEDNSTSVDMPPLYDLAIMNIAHYQTTADHRENLFIHGQVTLGITSDLSVEEFKQANPNGVRVGARVGHLLGQQGGFHTATAPESSSLRVALQDLEHQMVMIGARLIQRGGQAETAEAARISASAEASTLDTLTNNLSEGIEAALEDVALFLGESQDSVEYRLNTDFWESSLDPQMAMAIIQFGQQGIVGRQDQLHMIRRGKIELPEGRTDEQILADASSDMLDNFSEGL